MRKYDADNLLKVSQLCSARILSVVRALWWIDRIISSSKLTSGISPSLDGSTFSWTHSIGISSGNLISFSEKHRNSVFVSVNLYLFNMVV